MNKETKTATKNTIMLYFMSFAKMIFPLLTLPYLTRVLSVDCYGTVSYVKAIMQYMTIFMEFGFLLSATKDIVNEKGNKKNIGVIVGDVIVAKAILAMFDFFILIILMTIIPILRNNIVYTLLSFANVILTELMLDFLFRGIDKMEIITIRFVIFKGFATLLTFIFIKEDSDFMLIPLFDIVGSVVALVMVYAEINKLGIKISRSNIAKSISMLKDSAVYFASNMATTAFGALNTMLIGVFADSEQVAYWSVAMQLVSAVQSLYTPISNGIYPSMIRTKSLKFIKRVFVIFMPIVTVGCVTCVVMAKFVLSVVGGKEYVAAAPTFIALVPVLFFSFPSIVLGWPTLGPIGKQKETTMTTVITAIIQVFGLCVLLGINKFTLINIALLRGATEAIMMILRGSVCWCNRNEYSD